MSTPVLAGLVVTVAITALAWVLPLPDPGAPTATGTVRLRDSGLRTALVALGPLALAVTAVLAVTIRSDGDLVPFGLVLAVLAAVLGGGPVAAAVLRMAPPELPPAGWPLQLPPATVLRGGATIGVLERLAVSVALLASWPEGIAIVLAVKGLGRYPELRAHAGTSERFIIGTFASVLWALGCAGVALLGWQP